LSANLGGKLIQVAGASSSKATMLDSVAALVVLLFFFGGPPHKIKENNVKTGSLHQGINVKTCKQPFHGLVVFGPIIEALY